MKESKPISDVTESTIPFVVLNRDDIEPVFNIARVKYAEVLISKITGSLRLISKQFSSRRGLSEDPGFVKCISEELNYLGNILRIEYRLYIDPNIDTAEPKTKPLFSAIPTNFRVEIKLIERQAVQMGTMERDELSTIGLSEVDEISFSIDYPLSTIVEIRIIDEVRWKIATHILADKRWGTHTCNGSEYNDAWFFKVSVDAKNHPKRVLYRMTNSTKEVVTRRDMWKFTYSPRQVSLVDLGSFLNTLLKELDVSIDFNPLTIMHDDIGSPSDSSLGSRDFTNAINMRLTILRNTLMDYDCADMELDVPAILGISPELENEIRGMIPEELSKGIIGLIKVTEVLQAISMASTSFMTLDEIKDRRRRDTSVDIEGLFKGFEVFTISGKGSLIAVKVQKSSVEVLSCIVDTKKHTTEVITVSSISDTGLLNTNTFKRELLSTSNQSEAYKVRLY